MTAADRDSALPLDPAAAVSRTAELGRWRRFTRRYQPFTGKALPSSCQA